MARPVKAKATSPKDAKRKIAAAAKEKPETKREWARVIKTAESVLQSAGVKPQ